MIDAGGDGQLIQFPHGGQGCARIHATKPSGVQQLSLSPTPDSLPRPSTPVENLIGQRLPGVSLQQVGGRVLGCDEIADRWVAYYYHGAERDPRSESALHRAFLGARLLFGQLGVRVVGISSQSRSAQYATIIANRIDHLMLGDPALQVAGALALPTCRQSGQHGYQQLVLLTQANVIEWVLYPVRDPSAVARQLIAWMALSGRPDPSGIPA